MIFSDKVKYVRMRLGLSQEALAAELSVSAPTIWRWENETREPHLATLGKFYAYCEKRGISFEDKSTGGTL